MNQLAYTCPNIKTEDTEHTILSTASNREVALFTFAMVMAAMLESKGPYILDSKMAAITISQVA